MRVITEKNANYIYIVIISAFAFAVPALSGYLNIPLFNEDILILHWAEPQTLVDSFADFHCDVTGGPYWRPVVWSSYFLTKYLFGYSGIAYHLVNLLVYSALMPFLFIIFTRMGIDKSIAFASVMLFAVLPAHELFYAWIPGRTDLFMTFFLVISLYFYISSSRHKYAFLLSAFFYLLSILSKETTYAAVLLPILLRIFNFDSGKTNKQAFFAFSAALSIVLITLLYRYFVIGGSPFESSNFSNFTPSGVIINYFIYIPLAFVNADLLEKIYYHFRNINPVVYAAMIAMLSVLLYSFKVSTKENYRYILFGFAWFSLMIAPALANLMQWYVFAASIGLMIAIIGITLSIKNRYFQLTFWSVLILLCVFYIFPRGDVWQKVAKKTNYALSEMNRFDLSAKDTIIILAAPDKIERINSMKIGIGQAFALHTGKNNLVVDAPLRSEISFDSKIEKSTSSNSIVLRLNKGRFIKQGGKSTSIFKNDTTEYSYLDMNFKIINHENGTSVANVEISEQINYPIFFFDGKKFIKASN